MPVTKCEPETTRKASRKSVKTQETALSALLAQTEEVSVPLDSLIKSPLNVRTVPYSAESVSELADSIKGVPSGTGMNARLRRPFFSPAFSGYGLSEITSPSL